MFDNVFWKSYISTVVCLHQIAAAILELVNIQSNRENCRRMSDCIVKMWCIITVKRLCRIVRSPCERRQLYFAFFAFWLLKIMLETLGWEKNKANEYNPKRFQRLMEFRSSFRLVMWTNGHEFTRGKWRITSHRLKQTWTKSPSTVKNSHNLLEMRSFRQFKNCKVHLNWDR